MTAIAVQGTGLRHVRKTITFNGGAGAGLAGSEILPFTLTGVVWIEKFVIRCTTNLGFSAGGCTLDVGVSGGTDWSLAGWDVTTLTAGEFVGGSNGYNVGGGQLSNDVVAAAPAMKPAVANITSGVVVVDCFYRPVTDDGALAGDDIDTELIAAIWAYATRILTALDEDSTTLDLDATIRAAVGLASANLDTQLDAIPTAAEINAEVVDALATDTYAEPSAVPAATSSLKDKIGYLFAKSRNKRTQTATTETILRDDGSTTLGTSTKSDDGTTFTKGEDT